MLMSSKPTWIIGAGVFSLSSCTILDCAATAAWRRIEETTAIKDERWSSGSSTSLILSITMQLICLTNTTTEKIVPLSTIFISEKQSVQSASAKPV